MSVRLLMRQAAASMNKAVRLERPLKTDKPAFLLTKRDFNCCSLVRDPSDAGGQRAW
jgi:hypothetical protein